MAIARTQTLVQLTDELLALLDERAQREGTSRSELIRRAVDRYLAGDVEAAIDRVILDGYARHPAPTPDPLTVHLAIASIEEEPW